ncbi:unnamed protein product [Echinostoma caproni]|uniref:MIP-T3_C domain-containing protein n=1 Tax=Echinostoma caproni TaxID=27848 RepID=A0A183B0L9_9TREM|nr:unnamed protein product [Echinostoma caproni]
MDKTKKASHLDDMVENIRDSLNIALFGKNELSTTKTGSVVLSDATLGHIENTICRVLTTNLKQEDLLLERIELQEVKMKHLEKQRSSAAIQHQQEIELTKREYETR